MSSTTFRLGELFCGPGGIALGAKNAEFATPKCTLNIEPVWATDYDADTCETYRQNICPTQPEKVICEDIRKLDFNRLANISPIDGLAFGFPCNDFSIVGEQKGLHGSYGPLYLYAVKALQFFRPMWFLAENVGGLRNANEGSAFNNILNSFKDLGYRLVPHLYKFENYGVPQARHRIIIIGIRNDVPFQFRVPSTKPYATLNVSARYAIENPPIKEETPNHEKTRQSDTVKERLKYIKPGQNAFNANIPVHLQLNVTGAKISQIYKRLDPEKPSYTVTGSGGGGTHVYHWSENRALTNRERARLQTFPDDYIFYGSKESVRKQIGMAVPPKGAEVVLRALLQSIAGMNYPAIPSNITATENLFGSINYQVDVRQRDFR
jgi:DNA (cytosine-5)-methyltransferase 1